VTDVFAPLLETIQQAHMPESGYHARLIDSFPVALAKQGYRFKACVGYKAYHRPDAQAVRQARKQCQKPWRQAHGFKK
jgi:hypothetical protein